MCAQLCQRGQFVEAAAPFGRIDVNLNETSCHDVLLARLPVVALGDAVDGPVHVLAEAVLGARPLDGGDDVITEPAPAAGPIGRLSARQRFHWLVAPRSTVIQTSAVHSGLCEEPGAALEHLMKCMVLPVEEG